MISLRKMHIAILSLVLVTGIATASTDPVADTRQIMAGTVSTKSVKSAYLSGSRDGTAAFQGALSAYKAVRASEAPPVPVPVPTPVPTAAVAYDTAIGASVDADGFAALPLRSGAHRYFVNPSTGSDSNNCLTASAPCATLHHATTMVVNGAGDQVLVAEGSKLNEMIGQLDGQPLPWVGAKSGFSALYPTLWSSYDPADPANEAKYGRGDQRNARPILTAVAAQQLGGGAYGFIAIKGFDFNPGEGSGRGIAFLGAAHHILIENNVLRYTGLSFDVADYPALPTTPKVIVRNNSLYGMWSTGGRTGGLYVAGYVGPTVEDNVFYHDGWKIGGSRSDDMSVGGATVFSHSFYLQTDTTDAIVRRNLSADGAGDGGIARGDSLFGENLFIDNPAAMGLGGGPQYNVDRPGGVLFDAGYNAIIGSSSVPNGASGWAINTTNGKPGSRVHHNLIVRSANPLDPGGSGFSNNAAFNQPSYAQYDHNLMYKWVVSTGQVFWPSCGPNPAQCFTTYDANVWDGAAQGTNVSAAAKAFPNPYTAAQLYAALGFADKTAFITYAIEHPEAHIQRKARELLFAGYGMAQ